MPSLVLTNEATDSTSFSCPSYDRGRGPRGGRRRGRTACPRRPGPARRSSSRCAGRCRRRGGDEGAVDLPGARDGPRRCLCGGARHERAAGDGAQRAAPPLIIVRRENLVRRYSCCSVMLMRSASFAGTPMRGMSMASETRPLGRRTAGGGVDGSRTGTHERFSVHQKITNGHLPGIGQDSCETGSGTP